MKKLILILALLFVSNSLFSTPQDSCLKMIWGDDEVYYDSELHHWVGSSNPDSVRVDSCMGSLTYGKLFAKRYFYLQFQPDYYPFDNVLKSDTIKGVSEISSSKPDLKLKFEQLEAEFGTIYFQGLMFEENDSIALLNPAIRIFFSEFQYIDEILDTFLSEIDTLKNIVYEPRFGQVVSVKESNNEVQEILLSPSPVKNYLELNVLSGDISDKFYIYNLQGVEVLTTDFREHIDLSFLQSGVYFLKIGNNTYKFIKE